MFKSSLCCLLSNRKHKVKPAATLKIEEEWRIQLNDAVAAQKGDETGERGAAGEEERGRATLRGERKLSIM